MGRAATDIDVVIGARIRAVRLDRGLSQSDVADAIGITFQQLQKYETGKNRIAAATLVQISEAVDVALTELLPALDDVSDCVSLDLLNSTEVRALVDLYVGIRQPALRRAVMLVCEAMRKADRAEK
jgi:transcriptional regulator with XRE-family HTH domain